MTNRLNAEMLKAMRLIGAGRLKEAAATLQSQPGHDDGEAARSSRSGHVLDRVMQSLSGPGDLMRRAERMGAGLGEARGGVPRSEWAPLHQMAHARSAAQAALRGFLDRGDQGGDQGGNQGDGHGGSRGGSPFSAGPGMAVPDGAEFVSGSFSNAAGSRPYRLYVPSRYQSGRRVPLIIMLHGCTQSPDDFALGTRMNEAAEEHTCLVLYPGQTASANTQRCWNWFNENDQRRDCGEPLLISGMVRQVLLDHAVDPRQIHVAGLSAGGAAAAILGDAYPDLFAAIGVHSGLACGAARDMKSAFAAMQGGGTTRPRSNGAGAQSRTVPAIVFHGDRDGTVNKHNADAVVAQFAQGAVLGRHTEQGCVPGGHAYSRTLHTDASGDVVIEQWVVHGAGHAWFGGSAAGSYTDPRGPDATREMLRFFLAHPHPAPSA